MHHTTDNASADRNRLVWPRIADLGREAHRAIGLQQVDAGQLVAEARVKLADHMPGKCDWIHRRGHVGRDRLQNRELIGRQAVIRSHHIEDRPRRVNL